MIGKMQSKTASGMVQETVHKNAKFYIMLRL